MTEAVSKAGRWIDLANPTRFINFAGIVLPWLVGITLLVLAAGLWMSFQAPDDYQQGSTVKIMFIHVPFAWLSMMCYTVMSISAIGTLVWRHPLADVSAKAAAPIGEEEQYPDQHASTGTQTQSGVAEKQRKHQKPPLPITSS